MAQNLEEFERIDSSLCSKRGFFEGLTFFEKKIFFFIFRVAPRKIIFSIIFIFIEFSRKIQIFSKFRKLEELKIQKSVWPGSHHENSNFLIFLFLAYFQQKIRVLKQFQVLQNLEKYKNLKNEKF